MAKIALLISLIVIFDNINTQPDRKGQTPQFPVDLETLKELHEQRMEMLRGRRRSTYDNVPGPEDSEPSTSGTASRPSSTYENVPEGASESAGESPSRRQGVLSRLFKRKSSDSETESRGSSSPKRAKKLTKRRHHETPTDSGSDSDSETESESSPPSSPSRKRKFFGRRGKKPAAASGSDSDSETEPKSSSSRLKKIFGKRPKKHAATPARPAIQSGYTPAIHSGYTMDQDELFEYLQYMINILENMHVEEGTYRISPSSSIYLDDPREIEGLSSTGIAGKIKKACATSFDKLDLTSVNIHDTGDQNLESVWSSATPQQQKILALLFKNFEWYPKNKETRMQYDSLWVSIGPSVAAMKPRKGKEPNEEEMRIALKLPLVNTFMSKLNQWYIKNH